MNLKRFPKVRQRLLLLTITLRPCRCQTRRCFGFAALNKVTLLSGSDERGKPAAHFLDD
jgi:hypothetical protein